MPRGAFEEGAAKGTLLVASDEGGQILGYLLYRVAHGYASIAHLCVASEARRQGIGKALIEELKRRTSHLDGIKLKCRRDFHAHYQWPKWGFIARGKAVGRGADNAELVVWHLDHLREDLFTGHMPDKTIVAIDANVFFDLFWPDRPMRTLSGALLEPWIDDIVELALTSEIFNDIDRCQDPQLREISKTKARSYHEIRGSSSRIDPIEAELKKFYPSTVSLSPRDLSDIRHVAYAIIAEVKYFVTRDESLLAKAPQILEKFDVQLFAPLEFVSRLDSIEREQEYQPFRLGGSSLITKRLESEEIPRFIESFRLHPYETIIAFKGLIDSCLLDPRSSSLLVAQNSDGRMAAGIATKRVSHDKIRIQLLRLNSHALAQTVLRHLLMQTVVDAATSDARLIQVCDPHLTREVTDALLEIGFSQSTNGWIKPVAKGFMDFSTAREWLAEAGLPSEESCTPAEIDHLGTQLWPCKPVSPEITAYLIPIQAQWAEHFFDVDLAAQRLPGISGLREELHLGVEAVYFTASNITFDPPGHLLWYVSSGNEGLGSMQVKATSRLREVVSGSPKELFSRFHRLGVYRWKDIMDAARGNLDARLTALRFSHTEFFPSPLSPEQLRTFNVPPPYPGPRPIPFSTFQEIHHHAFKYTQ